MDLLLLQPIRLLRIHKPTAWHTESYIIVQHFLESSYALPHASGNHNGVFLQGTKHAKAEMKGGPKHESHKSA